MQLGAESIKSRATDYRILPQYWPASAIRITLSYGQFDSLLEAVPSRTRTRIGVAVTVPGILAIFAMRRGNGAAPHQNQQQTPTTGLNKPDWDRKYRANISVELTRSWPMSRHNPALRNYVMN